MLATVFLLINNDPTQALSEFASNTFSKELIALIFLVVFIVAIASIAIRTSGILALLCAAAFIGFIHMQVGIWNIMDMSMATLFIMEVVLVVIAAASGRKPAKSIYATR